MFGKRRATNETLIAELSKRFEAPKEFVKEYLLVNYGHRIEEDSVQKWLDTLSPTQRLYATYALSTNQRSWDTVAIVKPKLRTAVRRHLDIGCGYGGLLKAFASDATTSVGIEIDTQLAKYSKLNTTGLDVTIINDSIENVEISRLGQFDLVTCTEVIEHVANPQNLAVAIGNLLGPDGLLYLRMPNGRAIDAVKSDGHFLLFGISLLSREEAKAFKYATTGVEDSYRHMGEYYTYPVYESWLTAAGIRGALVETDRNYLGLWKMVAEKYLTLTQAYSEWIKNSEEIPYFNRQQVILRFAEYQKDFHAAYCQALTGGQTDKADFERDYITDFWTIIGLRE